MAPRPRHPPSHFLFAARTPPHMTLRDTLRSFEKKALRPALGVLNGKRRKKELALLHMRLDWMERRIIELERTIQENIGLQLTALDEGSGECRAGHPTPPRA